MERRKTVKKISARITVAAAVVGVSTCAVNLFPASAGTDGGGDVPAPAVIQIEPIEVITPERMTDAYILEETDAAPLSYYDVPFVALPVPMADDDQAVVFGICQDQGVAFPLVMALIEQESQFERTARSKTGDSGYMQINDCNAASLAEMGFRDLYDLEQNVGAGVYMLKCLFDKYGGDTSFVLMAYNAGEKGAQEMRNKGIEQTEYSAGIMERAEWFSSYIDDALKE